MSVIRACGDVAYFDSAGRILLLLKRKHRSKLDAVE